MLGLAQSSELLGCPAGNELNLGGCFATIQVLLLLYVGGYVSTALSCFRSLYIQSPGTTLRQSGERSQGYWLRHFVLSPLNATGLGVIFVSPGGKLRGECIGTSRLRLLGLHGKIGRVGMMRLLGKGGALRRLTVPTPLSPL